MIANWGYIVWPLLVISGVLLLLCIYYVWRLR